MRIAINTRLLLKNRLEGIGWFTYETARRIVRSHPEHQFFFLFDREFDPSFVFASNVTPVVLPPQSRHPILWYAWFEWSVCQFLRRNQIDLFLSPDGYLSLRTNVPQVVVVHDISFYHYPLDLPPVTSKYLNHYTPRFARKAARIATVSQYSKHDICSSYGIPPEKISVVLNGCNPLFSPLSQEEIASTRGWLTGNSPYFVFVGAFNPRKNVDRLIRAFGIHKQGTGSKAKLVLVGTKMFRTRRLYKAYHDNQFKDDIIFTGRLSVERLRRVIGAAIALVYPSYFEGFGIPLLEAMRCGVPIAASDCTSIPEVAGEAAIYFDPFNINAIAQCLRRIEADNQLRQVLISKGMAQSQRYSWDRTAESLFECMMQAANAE